MPARSRRPIFRAFANRQNFNLEDAEPMLADRIPTEQQDNIQQLAGDLQTSLDNPPSPESIGQLQITIESAREDGSVTVEEREAIAAAAQNVVQSTGLTEAEIDTITGDVEAIAAFALESRLPAEQQENLQQLQSDLQASIDNPPSEESMAQLQGTVESAIADGSLTPEEQQAIAELLESDS